MAKRLADILKLFSSGGSRKGYVDWMPNKVRVVSGGEGSCVCEMTVDEDLVNVNNHMHGGCMASIVDMVSSVALMTAKKPAGGVSVELSVSYMSAAKLGEDIVINAKTIKSGKNLAFLHVEISRKSDGATIAVGKHTKYVALAGEGFLNAAEALKKIKS